MELPPPGLLTNMMGWPRICETLAIAGRLSKSPSDPASIGTMNSMGFTGYFSAACAIPQRKQLQQIKTVRMILIFLLIFPSSFY
jgi:hypothetical protein